MSIESIFTATKVIERIPKSQSSKLLLPGSVAIVGAGCGELDLLTIQAARFIQSANAVVYDSLVSQEILSLCAPDCDRYFVGKRWGQPSAKQDDINVLLLALAQDGKRVVRLKGGDPHVFGRGAEEALYLAEHGIKSQFVSGITAALGCAASSGIPLTFRGLARSVTLVTGMQCDDSATHWHALLSHQSTLVFYMGKEQASHIEQQLLTRGVSEQLPLAFVTNGGRIDQVVTYGTLATLAHTASAIRVAGPSLLIIGEVVNIAMQLNQLLAQISINDDGHRITGKVRYSPVYAANGAEVVYG